MNRSGVFSEVLRASMDDASAQGAVEIGTIEKQPSTDAVVREVTRILNACGYPELREVEVIDYEGTLILRGKVTSYYLKQLAQNRVSQVKGVARFSNELDVMSPAVGSSDRLKSMGADQASLQRGKETKDASDLMSQHTPFENERVAAMTDAEIDALAPHELVELILFAHPFVIPEDSREHLRFYDRETLLRLAFLVRRMCRQQGG